MVRSATVRLPGSERRGVLPAAVKLCKTGASYNIRLGLQHEISMLERLSKPGHVNIVGLVCESEIAKNPMLVMELLPRGDLRQVLRDFRPPPGAESLLTEFQRISMSADIARGMIYLSSRGVVHGELAAKNCLVGADLTVKIADFGLAMFVGTGPVSPRELSDPPVRWMSPESILSSVFTFKSDVWAMGIVLWEIMSFGTIPFVEDKIDSCLLSGLLTF